MGSGGSQDNNKIKVSDCYHCKIRIQCPNTDCYAFCKTCKHLNLFLCHAFDPNEAKNLRIKCMDQGCIYYKREYTILSCPSCRGHFALRDFKLGQVYTCPCAFTATLLPCINMKHILGLPPNRNTEKQNLFCRQCQISFRYIKCKKCSSVLYARVGEDKKYRCSSEDCGETYENTDRRSYLHQRISGPSHSSDKNAAQLSK